MIDQWNQRRVKAGLTAWDPDTVYHLAGVPDERIDIDIDTTGVALLVRRATQEHRTQLRLEAERPRRSSTYEPFAGIRRDRRP